MFRTRCPTAAAAAATTTNSLCSAPLHRRLRPSSLELPRRPVARWTAPLVAASAGAPRPGGDGDRLDESKLLQEISAALKEGFAAMNSQFSAMDSQFAATNSQLADLVAVQGALVEHNVRKVQGLEYSVCLQGLEHLARLLEQEVGTQHEEAVDALVLRYQKSELLRALLLGVLDEVQRGVLSQRGDGADVGAAVDDARQKAIAHFALQQRQQQQQQQQEQGDAAEQLESAEALEKALRTLLNRLGTGEPGAAIRPYLEDFAGYVGCGSDEGRRSVLLRHDGLGIALAMYEATLAVDPSCEDVGPVHAATSAMGLGGEWQGCSELPSQNELSSQNTPGEWRLPALRLPALQLPALRLGVEMAAPPTLTLDAETGTLCVEVVGMVGSSADASKAAEEMLVTALTLASACRAVLGAAIVQDVKNHGTIFAAMVEGGAPTHWDVKGIMAFELKQGLRRPNGSSRDC